MTTQPPITSTEISNLLHRLNLDRPDIAALPEGASMVCNITTLRQAAELIRRMAAKSGWQPIEAAPKDGTAILVLDRYDNEVSRAYWCDGLWQTFHGAVEEESHYAGWMLCTPLPEQQGRRDVGRKAALNAAAAPDDAELVEGLITEFCKVAGYSPSFANARDKYADAARSTIAFLRPYLRPAEAATLTDEKKQSPFEDCATGIMADAIWKRLDPEDKLGMGLGRPHRFYEAAEQAYRALLECFDVRRK